MAKAIPLPVVQTGFERSVEAGKKAVGTIRLPVDIDSSAFSKLNQPLGRITGLATEFEKSIAASNARVLAFGASVGILNGVANAFKSILTNGIAVEKALAEIGTISGQSAAQLDKLGDSLFDVAKNTSQSFGVAAKAALEFSRQGLSVEETVKRTNDALTLTRFTSLSAADAVDTLTAAVNSFAGSGITTTEIINKLIAVDTAFAVSAEDLANGLARAGSIAQEVGVSFDELNGLITVAQERTARGGSVIGNALKTIFTRIRSDDTINALRNVGVESLDAAGNLRDVVPILTELSNKLKDLGKGERIQILEAVASKYNINILSALLGDIGNAQGQFAKAVGTGLNASNEATERQIELNKTLSAILNATSESAAQLANNLAKIGVDDSLKSLLGYVNSFLDSINKLLSSDDTGGNIARGIIKGFSDVLFTVGLPIIAAIFVKLTKDIATFGVESLQTILGINQKVKERQALEQAVTNTLISNKGIMDQILAASGNRVKQEQILLDAYNKQIQALSVIQSISASVAPTLQGAGLSAGSGGVTRKKAAGGYLPAQEAADVRRGVGGASSSSKVVSIPNFAFGGGKKGTMIANTSEYIVPNYANGGSAIFNQDMVKAYGLPAGAKKIGAAGGYVPNFAKYVYDSDRIPADKNATLKAILASSAKKNLLIAPAGAGKSTLAAGMGKFLTGAADVANATEIDILSGAGRTKDGGLSKNLESIMAAVNSSGGKVSYLYTKNFDILSRRAGRTDPSEGDLRSKKQIAGTAYAPLNQFDFMGMVKSRSNSFGMVRGAGGYIPNFADEQDAGQKQNNFAALIGKRVESKDNTFLKLNEFWVSQDSRGQINVNESDQGAKPSKGDEINRKKIQFASYGIPAKSSGQLDDIKKNLSEHGKNAAVDLAQKMTDKELPSDKVQGKLAATFNPGSLASFAGTIFEASVGALLGDKGFQDYSEQAVTSAFDLNVSKNGPLKKNFGIPLNVDYLEVKGSDSPPLIKSVAKKIYQVTALGRAAQEKKRITKEEAAQRNIPRPVITKTEKGGYEVEGKSFTSKEGVIEYLGGKYERKFGINENPSAKALGISVPVVPRYPVSSRRGAGGYIPNFAQGGPLEDAVQREMAAGLDPSQIRVTSDGKLRNPQNPNGLAVINTRDEPDGKVPNFARPIGPETEEQMRKREARNAREREIRAVASGRASDITSRPATSANSTEQDSVNKSILSTNKLMLAFSALSITTSTLQSTFKNTDSVIGKVASSLTQVATTTAGYASIGSLAGETFKGKGGALGKVAGYMGPAGAVVGAGIGIYQAVDDYFEGQKNERLDLARKETAKALAGADDPEEEKRILLKRKTASEESKKTLIDERTKNLQPSRDAIARASGVAGGGFGGFAGMNNIVGNASNLAADSKIEEELLKTEAALTVNAEELEKVQVKIELSKIRQDKLAKKESEDLVKRVALTTQIGALSVAFATGQNKALKERANREAQFIKNSANLNDYQKQEESNRLALLSIDDKISDTKQSILQSTIQELAKSSIGTAEKKMLEDLKKRIAGGEKIVDIEKELNKLGIDGNSERGITIKNALFEAQIKENSLKTEKEILKIKQQSQIQEQIRNKNNEIELRAISERVTFEKQLENLKKTGGRAIEDLDLQAGAKSLQNQISKQPFATRAQQSQLERFNAEIRRETELRSINRTAIDAQSDSFENLKSKYTEQINLLSFLGNDQKKQIKEQLASAKTAEDLQTIFAKTYSFLPAVNKTKNLGKTGAALNETSLKKEQSYLSEFIETTDILNNANKLSEEQTKQINKEKDKQLKLVQDILTFELALSNLREKSPARAGAVRAITDISKETESFSETFSYNTTLGFRDGLRDALSAAVSGTDDLRGALQGVAQGFLKTMQQAFLQQASNNVMLGLSKALPSVFQMPKTAAKGGYIQKFAAGGMVTGGSGIRDDVPAMLSAGEYVMRKSAVQKYGAENIAKMNSGGIFLPGVRGGSEISGYDQLSKFANQTTTSGATDVLKGQRSAAFANLEDQSVRLSRFGLMNEDTIKGEITSAQQQGLDLISKREAYRTQQRKAMQQQIVGTALALAINVGVGKLGQKKSSYSIGKDYQGPIDPKIRSTAAYGGLIRGFNNGGGPTDDIPALLMGGEYVMDRATTRKYGKQYLDSMNSGRAKFAEGGYAGAEAETTTESTDSKAKVDANTGTAVNISINVSGGNSSTESQGQTSQGGVDYKKMSERIKAVVLETLNEEKRLGGSLRTR